MKAKPSKALSQDPHSISDTSRKSSLEPSTSNSSASDSPSEPRHDDLSQSGSQSSEDRPSTLKRPNSAPSSSSQPPQKEAEAKDSRKAPTTGRKKRYPCPFPGCEKTFSTSGHSSRHSRIHTGVKPYRCSYPGCNAQFSRYDNSLQHYRTHIISSKSGKKGRGRASTSKAVAPHGGSGMDAPAWPSSGQSSPTAARTFPVADAQDGKAMVPTTLADPAPYASATSSAKSGVLTPSYLHPAQPLEPGVPDGPSSRLEPHQGWDAYQSAYTGVLGTSPSASRNHDDRSPSKQERALWGVPEGRAPAYADYPSRLAHPRSYVSWTNPSESVGPTPSYSGSSQVEAADTWPMRTAAARSVPGRAPSLSTTEGRRLSTSPVLAKSSLLAASSLRTKEPSTARAPILHGSHTFDLGRHLPAYPLVGSGMDGVTRPTSRSPPPPSHLAGRRLLPRLHEDFALSPTWQQRGAEFHIRKSGSLPSLLSLDIPPSESSHSLVKYSLSSCPPARTTQLPRPTLPTSTPETYASPGSVNRVNKASEPVTLPPLSRFS